MRAKLRVSSVIPYQNNGIKTQETLIFNAVCPKQFGAEGSDENNTYSKWTPTAELQIVVTNPNLFGRFKQGEQYYVDFTKASE